MLVEKKVTNIVCDCCNSVINPNNITGSNPYIKNSTGKTGIDICVDCSFKIFDLLVMPDIDLKVLKSYIEEIKLMPSSNKDITLL
jgi:hypothetical protein